MKIDGMTPRQYAHDLALGWLRNAYNGNTGDLADLTPSQKARVKEAIASLHKRLAEQADLSDVLLLGE
jgi:hypothetical protein